MFEYDGFCHSEFMQRRKSLFAPVATVFDAAKRQLDSAARAVIIDEDLTAAQRFSDPHLALAIGGPHTGDQPEIGAIGDADRIGLVLKRNGGKDRSENLFLSQRVALGNRAIQCRCT